MTHPVAIGLGVAVALLLLLEVLAVPLATRAVGTAVGRCIEHRSLSIEAVARPVVPRLLVGRARDVVLRVEDAELQGLRVAEAFVEVPHAVLPWALGDPEPSSATVRLRIDEAAVADRLREMTPLGIRPSVDLDDGVARIGVPGTGLQVSLTLAVGEDGSLVLRPGAGSTGWWERLGLAREFELPPSVRVDALTLGDRQLAATLHLDELPGADGDACDRPVAVEGEPTVAPDGPIQQGA